MSENRDENATQHNDKVDDDGTEIPSNSPTMVIILLTFFLKKDVKKDVIYSIISDYVQSLAS